MMRELLIEHGFLKQDECACGGAYRQTWIKPGRHTIAVEILPSDGVFTVKSETPFIRGKASELRRILKPLLEKQNQ